MKPLTKSFVKPALMFKQHGVVLFFALIALLAMSLAAVALIRSVDTNTMIAGNLSFKQAATTSGDAGVEFAVAWLNTTAAANATKDVLTDATHTFNINAPALGYYSSASSAVSLTDPNAANRIKWDGTDSKAVPDDGSGNKTYVVIQRMCPIAGVPGPDCLFGVSTNNNNPANIILAPKVCATCPVLNGQTIQFRITARSEAPRNSISYVQAFAY